MNTNNYIYSETIGTMIPKGFTTRKVLFSKDGSTPYKICNSFHWTWNEEDAVYYRDDVDDIYKYEMPINGEKCFNLVLGMRSRYLVKIG